MTASHPADAVVLVDLATPRFSDEAAEIVGMMGAISDEYPLDSGVLHQKAVEETGLDDFGPRDYIERLDLLLGAYVEVPRLSPGGRVNLHMQMLQLLKNRLLLTDLLRREPGIAELDLAPPLVIAGLPRTGTTHLQQLLAATGVFRTLPYWESLEPFPTAAEQGVVPDPRRERCEGSMGVMHMLLPHLVLMHEMDTPDHVHEEIGLLANDFSSMYFETLADIPQWRGYYLAHDQAPHYQYLRLQLKALQHLRGGERWLLKSPQHLEQLPVLAEVFPDAPVILTHRDPARVVTSMATMIAYTDRIFLDAPDPGATGRRWADRIETMLASLMRDRDVLGPERSMDLPLESFLADQTGTLERVFALAGIELTDSARTGAREYLDSHAKGHLGTVDYRPEAVGLSTDDLRARFADYSTRFLG